MTRTRAGERARSALVCLATLLLPATGGAAGPVIDALEVKDMRGAAITRLVPADTVIVDVTVSHPNGFQSIKTCAVGVWYERFRGYSAPVPLGTEFEWNRSAPRWVENVPGTDWKLLPELCVADTLTDSTAPQLLRFAAIVSSIARASEAGSWVVSVWMPQATASYAGLDMAEHISLRSPDTVARFAPGPPGAQLLPLGTPPSAALRLEFTTNTAAQMLGLGTALRGATFPADQITIAEPSSPVLWGFNVADQVTSGALDSTWVPLSTAIVANDSLTDRHGTLALTLTVPTGISEQSYEGALGLELRSASGLTATSLTIPLTAVVTTAGLAADSAIAEVHPQRVTVGSLAAPFTTTLHISPSAGSTGVDLVRIALPPGYGPPAVAAVRVDGASVPFVDVSQPALAAARLVTPVSAEAVIAVDFAVDAPPAADAAGCDFVVSYDDTRTAVDPQTARPGDANGVPDGDGWLVVVDPGPPALLSISPATVVVPLDSALAFTALVQDAFGNATVGTPAWRVEGGLGTIDPTGRFVATAVGAGLVIAELAALGDTAVVSVDAPTMNVRATVLEQQSRSVLPLADAVEVFSVRLTNSSPRVATLTSLLLSDASSEAASSLQSDANWAPLELYALGSRNTPPGLLTTAVMSAGKADFSRLELSIAAGDSLTLIVRGGASKVARDGDTLDLRLAGPDDLVVEPQVTVQGDWPLDPHGAFVIDGMSAAQVGTAAVAPVSFASGSVRNLALDVTVPANGYASDVLERLNVINLGAALPGIDIDRMEAWTGVGLVAFDPASAVRLGDMTFTGNRWELTGLALPVPTGGSRIFVTVDIASNATEGRTIQLAVPTGSDVGFGMASGNDGPLDRHVINPASQSISEADRVVVSAALLAPQTAPPGARDVVLMDLGLANNYFTSKRLVSLVFTNATTGTGTPAQLDQEFRAVKLRLDGDADGQLDGLAVDPLLRTGFFSAQTVRFDGLDMEIAARGTVRLFLTADVAASQARDGDVLAVTIDGNANVQLDDESVVIGEWPVTSGAPCTVDGMAAHQIVNLGSPGASLGPLEGPVAVMDVILPPNGYQEDRLQRLRVVNLGSADQGDLAELRLWRDGGDGAFEPAGDDVDLGVLNWTSSGWESSLLAEDLAGSGAHVFVAATAAGALSDSATVQLAIPLGGIEVTSSNDGPIDAVVENPHMTLLSSAPLLATLEVAPSVSTIGQPVLARMIVRNASSERIDGILAPSFALFGPGQLTWSAGPSPPSLSLDPAQVDTLVWQYVSVGPGEVYCAGYAVGTGASGGLARRSLVVQSNRHRIFSAADDMALFPVESMPFSIGRGQTGVVPLSLTFTNLGGETASGVRVRALRLHLEDELERGLVPAELLSQVVVNEGTDIYLTKSAIETSGSQVDLTLATPVLVEAGDPVTLSLGLDILPETLVRGFRIGLWDTSDVLAEDATSGAPVRIVLEGASFPVQSGLARIVAASTALQMSAASPPSLSVGQGQRDVGLATFSLVNPGIDGLSADVRVASLRARLVDSAGAVVQRPGEIVERLRVRTVFQTCLDRPVSTAQDSTLVLALSSLLVVPVNTPLAVTVDADLRVDAPLGPFCLELLDSATVDARDGSTGAPVPVLYESKPLRGTALLVQAPAEELRVAGSALFPAAVISGQPDVAAMSLGLRHTGAVSSGHVRVEEIVFRCVDDRRDPLDAGALIERLEIRARGHTVAAVDDFGAIPGVFVVSLPALTVAPTESLGVSVYVDFRPSAPASSLELTVGVDGVVAFDANLGTPIATGTESSAAFPLTSGLVRIQSPARDLDVSLDSLMPAVLAPDGLEVPFARLTLANAGGGGSGPITVDRLRIRADDGTGAALVVGLAARRLAAYLDGVPWAESVALQGDSTTVVLIAPQPSSIDFGEPRTFELRFETQTDGSPAAFRLGLDQADIGVIQPDSPLLRVNARAADGKSFPLWSAVGNLSGLSLEESYANFPNPFAAGREETTFVYYLPSESQVTLRIWTLLGERVAGLLDDQPRAAGLHQSDRWDGRNGEGAIVRNGVYLAELLAKLADGGELRSIRKVAVVR